jgi:aryl-alcohol dehydrogenase-like predicted oxidoreductase
MGGSWAFGWGPQEDNDSTAAIYRAMEFGINWIDTAPAYGAGRSETVVGKALRGIGVAARPMVFTKCGLVWRGADKGVPPIRCLRPESIRRECEGSLNRLGIDQIDLYQFHWPDETGVAVEDSWGELVRLKDEGKVRAIGVSNFPTVLLNRCENIAHVDSLQPPFSLIRRSAARDEFLWCRANKTGIICYSPLQSGILTDRFTVESRGRMAPDDWRLRASEFQNGCLESNLALRDSLFPIAARFEVSVSSIAIAWILSWPDVTGAIVGARRPEQVEDWANAWRVALSPRDFDEIGSAIHRSGAGSGPLAPTSLTLPA